MSRRPDKWVSEGFDDASPVYRVGHLVELLNEAPIHAKTQLFIAKQTDNDHRDYLSVCTLIVDATGDLLLVVDGDF